MQTIVLNLKTKNSQKIKKRRLQNTWPILQSRIHIWSQNVCFFMSSLPELLSHPARRTSFLCQLLHWQHLGLGLPYTDEELVPVSVVFWAVFGSFWRFPVVFRPVFRQPRVSRFIKTIKNRRFGTVCGPLGCGHGQVALNFPTMTLTQ